MNSFKKISAAAISAALLTMTTMSVYAETDEDVDATDDAIDDGYTAETDEDADTDTDADDGDTDADADTDTDTDDGDSDDEGTGDIDYFDFFADLADLLEVESLPATFVQDGNDFVFTISGIEFDADSEYVELYVTFFSSETELTDLDENFYTADFSPVELVINTKGDASISVYDEETGDYIRDEDKLTAVTAYDSDANTLTVTISDAAEDEDLANVFTDYTGLMAFVFTATNDDAELLDFQQVFVNYGTASSTDDGTDDSTDPDSSADDADDSNAATGVALAVIPVIIAGAAVVVAARSKK